MYDVDNQVTDEMAEQLPNLESFDGNISILIDELDHSKSQLEEERNAHAEAVASLQQQLDKLEEYGSLQTEQCLKLEEEKAKAKGEAAALQRQLDSQTRLSETCINNLKLKLEKSHSEFEAEMEKQQREMQSELSSAHKKVKELQQKANILECNIRDMQETQKGADIEVECGVSKEVTVESSHQDVSIEHLKVSLERLETECAQISQLKEQLQNDNTRMGATEQRMHAEILDLQEQLSAIEKELNDQSEVYTNEISRLKDDLEIEKERNAERTAIQLEEMHSTLMKQMDESAQKYEQKLETVEQDLKASEHREISLQDKLTKAGVQCEKLVSKIADLTQSEAKWQECANELEHTQAQYLSAISQLKADVQKYQTDLSLLQGKEIQHSDTISRLQKELEQRTSFEEEIDFIPAGPVQSPNRSPYKSDSEAQGKLIAQMKSRLEKLQKLLLKSSQSDSNEVPNAELSLVQELLANNVALDSAAKQMRRNFEAKNQELSDFLVKRDSELKQLQSEMERDQKAMEALANSNTHQLLERMDTFHGNSNKSLDKYRARIEAAAAMLESIRNSIHDRSRRQISALESALSDLNQSHSEVCTYKDEIERLKAQMDQLHCHDASSDLRTARETSRSPGGSKRRVDEGSGQLIDNSSEIDDAQCQQNLLQQKDNEIETLKDELENIRRKEKRTRAMIDELEQDLTERKRELLTKAAELQQKETLIKELKGKLSVAESEPTEGEAQYVRKQPLEASAEVNERLEV
jgi:chromosome segregation ATPase